MMSAACAQVNEKKAVGGVLGGEARWVPGACRTRGASQQVISCMDIAAAKGIKGMKPV